MKSMKKTQKVTRTKMPKRWTMEELRKLPAAKRDAILRAAAEHAEPEYRTNRDLAAFEAFGKDDLHGDSSSAETR